ncbi:MAG: monovalent cation/H(+) antiporter subunit G [Ignisphaera sp.]|nr:monovalent cation/H(+) antiporter subunit G [Ignisphaera sp.]MCX8168281.1 monovalent cation/H(+) antiporter subunit G [Ignisphaera sp.]MDW8086036.1 monovalent cation/H(+) antiporter subunit G [Ignisphaera sp.]
MDTELINWTLVVVGQILVAVGVFCDFVAALLMIRFPNFYVRLHALTIGSIGGAVVPAIGAALIAAGSPFLGMYRWFLAGGALVTALFIFILGGAGAHAIARATYRAKAAEYRPCYVDQLAEDRGEVGC